MPPHQDVPRQPPARPGSAFKILPSGLGSRANIPDLCSLLRRNALGHLLLIFCLVCAGGPVRNTTGVDYVTQLFPKAECSLERI